MASVDPPKGGPKLKLFTYRVIHLFDMDGIALFVALVAVALSIYAITQANHEHNGGDFKIHPCHVVDNGFVCADGSNLIVKALNHMFSIDNSTTPPRTVFSSHIHFDTNAQYDIGTAEKKLRYLFAAD